MLDEAAAAVGGILGNAVSLGRSKRWLAVRTPEVYLYLPSCRTRLLPASRVVFFRGFRGFLTLPSGSIVFAVYSPSAGCPLLSLPLLLSSQSLPLFSRPIQFSDSRLFNSSFGLHPLISSILLSLPAPVFLPPPSSSPSSSSLSPRPDSAFPSSSPTHRRYQQVILCFIAALFRAHLTISH